MTRGPDRDDLGRLVWLCRCDCGTRKSILTGNLAHGTTRSCGCLLREARLWNALLATRRRNECNRGKALADAIPRVIREAGR